MTPAEYQAAREAHARHVARMARTLRGVRMERSSPAPAKPQTVRRGRSESIWRMVQTAADAYRRQGYRREKALRAAVGLVEAWQACPRVEFARWLAAIEPRVAA